MKIVLNANVLVGKDSYMAGDEVDIEADVAKQIIEQGLGAAAEQPKRAPSKDKSDDAAPTPAAKKGK